jgi:ring-1,2-phenylacetyl-CoA epoxidase subunit PaaD
MLTSAKIYEALQQVSDPEIPALSVIDLGMITDVCLTDSSAIVKMIPTYAACPATSFIKNHIKSHLKEIFADENIEVIVDTSIHWNTNMITELGKQKLKNFGIAAPRKHNGSVDAELLSGAICPHCESDNTVLRTPFGSTLCRAIQFCKNCNQTFEQFKPFAAE